MTEAAAPRPAPAPKRSPQHARRRLLRTILLAGGVLGADLAGFLPIAYAQSRRLRPPGALDEKDFLASCIKCGQCVQVCPVQAIKLADLVDGFGVGTPHIDARDQACDFSCDVAQCILACPTGALTYTKPATWSVRPGAPLAAKPTLLAEKSAASAKENAHELTLNLEERIGVARLTRPESCLAWQGKGYKGTARGPGFRGKLKLRSSDGSSVDCGSVDCQKPVRIADYSYDAPLCDLCVQACPIKGAISMETIQASDGREYKSPVVHEPCVGCGTCEMICPTEPSSIEIIAGEGWRT